MDITYNQKIILDRLSSVLRPFIFIRWNEMADMIAETGSDKIRPFCNMNLEQQITDILQNPSMHPYLKEFWNRITNNGIIKISVFDDIFSKYLLEFDCSIFIQCCLNIGLICQSDEYYLLKRPRLNEYLNRVTFPARRNGRDDTGGVIRMFFSGYTLQEVGDYFKLTREGVRLVIKNQIKDFPLLFEDYFREPFQAFQFSREDFAAVFPEVGIQGHRYLSVRYGKKQKDKIQINKETVGQYSGLWKNRVVQFIKDQTELNRPKLSSQDIVLNILSKNTDNPMPFDDLYAEYVKHADGKPAASVTVYNFINSEGHIIWNQYNQVRLYKLSVEPIWNTIDFNRYKDSIIASDLIYRQYPGLMEEQRIKDSRELFYIIKNSLSEYWKGDFQIKPRRVPIIVVGEMTDAEQAVNFLKKISPVSHADFYKAYNQRYGIKREIAQGNPNMRKALAPYNMNKLYIYGYNVDDVDKSDKNSEN